MTRETLVEILNHELTQQLTAKDIAEILIEYCILKGKYEELNVKFNAAVQYLLESNQWQPFYNIAKEELMRKYIIETVYDKGPSNILAMRKILLYL